jgi:hypothetical protein
MFAPVRFRGIPTSPQKNLRVPARARHGRRRRGWLIDRASPAPPPLLLLRDGDGGEECFVGLRSVRRVVLEQNFAAEAQASAASRYRLQQANADRFAANVLPVIEQIKASGATSLRAIAKALNACGIATVRGGVWTPVQVTAVLRRAS